MILGDSFIGEFLNAHRVTVSLVTNTEELARRQRLNSWWIPSGASPLNALIAMRTFPSGEAGDVRCAGPFGFEDGGDNVTAREATMVTGFEPCVRPEPRARTKLDSG